MNKWFNLILTLMIIFCLVMLGYQEFIKGNSNLQMDVNPSVDRMPQIIDILVESDYYIALCQDGTVWSWDKDSDMYEAKKIQNLEGVTRIADVGSAIYALTKEGYIYAWGSNKDLLVNPVGNNTDIYDEPIRLNKLCDIVELDAKNGNAFAVDADGNFYMWGLYVYGYENEQNDKKPGFPNKALEYVNNVKSIFAGAGNYNYFVREDGSIFSIMESDRFESNVYDFIFPHALCEKKDTHTLTLDNIPYIDLREGSKYGFTILYELDDINNVELIGSDGYTVFMYGEDQSLTYWESNTIKFHDNKDAMSEPKLGCENYNGKFEKVDIKKILGVGEEDPHIIEICSGKENVFFLTDNGDVFFSEYVTSEKKDVEYYDLSSTNPNREYIETIHDMALKKVSFKKLDLKNIMSINTDGNYQFYAVNDEGRYFVLDMQ